MAVACKFCILTRGLRGDEIASLPQNEEELAQHIEREHRIPVQREGESAEECMARFRREYPGESGPHSTSDERQITTRREAT